MNLKKVTTFHCLLQITAIVRIRSSHLLHVSHFCFHFATLDLFRLCPQLIGFILFAPPEARATFLQNDLQCNHTCSVIGGSLTYWGEQTEKIRHFSVTFIIFVLNLNQIHSTFCKTTRLAFVRVEMKLEILTVIFCKFTAKSSGGIT